METGATASTSTFVDYRDNDVLSSASSLPLVTSSFAHLASTPTKLSHSSSASATPTACTPKRSTTTKHHSEQDSPDPLCFQPTSSTSSSAASNRSKSEQVVQAFERARSQSIEPAASSSSPSRAAGKDRKGKARRGTEPYLDIEAVDRSSKGKGNAKKGKTVASGNAGLGDLTEEEEVGPVQERRTNSRAATPLPFSMPSTCHFDSSPLDFDDDFDTFTPAPVAASSSSRQKTPTPRHVSVSRNLTDRPEAQDDAAKDGGDGDDVAPKAQAVKKKGLVDYSSSDDELDEVEVVEEVEEKEEDQSLHEQEEEGRMSVEEDATPVKSLVETTNEPPTERPTVQDQDVTMGSPIREEGNEDSNGDLVPVPAPEGPKRRASYVVEVTSELSPRSTVPARKAREHSSQISMPVHQPPPSQQPQPLPTAAASKSPLPPKRVASAAADDNDTSDLSDLSDPPSSSTLASITPSPSPKKKARRGTYKSSAPLKSSSSSLLTALTSTQPSSTPTASPAKRQRASVKAPVVDLETSGDEEEDEDDDDDDDEDEDEELTADESSEDEDDLGKDSDFAPFSSRAKGPKSAGSISQATAKSKSKPKAKANATKLKKTQSAPLFRTATTAAAKKGKGKGKEKEKAVGLSATSASATPSSSQRSLMPSSSFNTLQFGGKTAELEDDETLEKHWKIMGLDKLVWVLVEDGSGGGKFWWAGDIVSTLRSQRPLKIKLHQDGSNAIGKATDLDISLAEPSHKNLLSFRTSTGLRPVRFHSSNFVVKGTTSVSPEEFSSVRQKAEELERQREEDDDDDDDLGDIFIAPKSARPARAASTPEPEQVPAMAEPDSDDDLLNDGPIVAAFDYPENAIVRSGSVWWPAQVLEEVSRPTDGRGQARYKIRFITGEEKVVVKSSILTPIQAKFFKVTMGQTKLDFDKETFDEFLSSHPNILQRIIDDEYLPAKEWSDTFYKGGKARKGLSNESQYGELNSDDTDLITDTVQKWQRGVGEDQLFPPTGSARYNALSANDQVDFASKVTIPILVFLFHVDDSADEPNPYSSRARECLKDQGNSSPTQDELEQKACEMVWKDLSTKTRLSNWFNGVRSSHMISADKSPKKKK